MHFPINRLACLIILINSHNCKQIKDLEIPISCRINTLITLDTSGKKVLISSRKNFQN